MLELLEGARKYLFRTISVQHSGNTRVEETSAHNAVREALVNCIVHQDLNAMGNIVVTRDESSLTFSNPGMMLVSKRQYFQGGRSICRNPTLQKMFMMLGRAEKAGSGVDKILSGWNDLGWSTPVLTEAGLCGAYFACG